MNGDPLDELDEQAAEIARLRTAIRRLAEQDATLSVCDGNVTVTMDATLTDAERAALHWFAHYGLPEHRAATLRGLLERLA
jgi:transcriptional regulator GlxA family with amidase domain